MGTDDEPAPDDEAEGGCSINEGEMDELVIKYRAPLSFCVNIWMSFAFQAEVTLNCKLFKSYSLLRSELQVVLLKAQQHLTFSLPGSRPAVTQWQSSQAQGKKASDKSEKTKNDVETLPALKLAELLCSTFASQPATSVATGDDLDDEDATVESNLENSQLQGGHHHHALVEIHQGHSSFAFDAPRCPYEGFG